MITFLVMSSTGDPYTIYCDASGGRVAISCTCQAGELGQMCKHKATVITGDDSLLYDEGQRAAFNEAHAACQATSIPTLYEELSKELKVIDKEERVVRTEFKKRRNSTRGRFARMLSEGVS
ncbi:MAG: hypothetical protein ISR64_08610 [Deltaproteobacteria bacterium]|nr:hypothetical protein [Deltaproteobacteria bacterium]